MTTKAEKAWMDAIVQIGCIACLLDGHPGTPGAVHHLLRGGRRIGHLSTICLCDPGHHQNGAPHKISRHPFRERFEQRYGTEDALLEITRALVAQHRNTTVQAKQRARFVGVDIDRIHYRRGAIRNRGAQMKKTREEYRRDAARPNAASALVIRHPGGLYFAGFGKPPESVKWTGTLADARLFNATALSQAERYIERIKEKDSLYMGMRPVKISIVEDKL